MSAPVAVAEPVSTTTVAEPGLLLGYARVSTEDQHLALQEDALREVGCWRIYTDKLSGSLRSRPELDRMLGHLRPGDTLVVWKLDRLGRSLRHLLDTVALLEERGVGFKSLRENLDTTTAAGRLVFHIFGALAQFEREMTLERTHAGLAAARDRGRVGGRPPSMTPEKVAAAQAMLAAGQPVTAIARALEVSRASIYRHVAAGPPVNE